MSELDIVKGIYKKSKILVLSSIVWFVLFLIMIIVLVTTAVSTINSSYDYIYGTDPYAPVQDNTTTILACTAVLVIICIAYAIFNLVYAIKIIIDSGKLTRSHNKTMYLVLSILGIFFLGLISYIVLWVVAKNEAKAMESGSNGSYGQPQNPQGPQNPYPTNAPAQGPYDFPPRREN